MDLGSVWWWWLSKGTLGMVLQRRSWCLILIHIDVLWTSTIAACTRSRRVAKKAVAAHLQISCLPPEVLFGVGRVIQILVARSTIHQCYCFSRTPESVESFVYSKHYVDLVEIAARADKGISFPTTSTWGLRLYFGVWCTPLIFKWCYVDLFLFFNLYQTRDLVCNWLTIWRLFSVSLEDLIGVTLVDESVSLKVVDSSWQNGNSLTTAIS